MKIIVLCFLIINILKVNGGLLGETLSPVTETVQNNALLDEHEHKNEEKKKGLVSNLVDGLDSGLGTVVDPLKKLLNKDKKDAKQPAATPTTPEETKKDKIDTTTPKTDTKDPTKTANKEDTTKDVVTTPETPTNVTADTPKLESDQSQINVTRRVNFDGSKCPTGTDRAHDDTCKEVQ